MTQTVTTLHRGWVLHASDRLLTRLDGREHDVRSNKSIVVATRRVVGVISYSGSATFAHPLPTDEWLVRSVLGIGEGRRPGWPRTLNTHTAGAIASRLEEALDRLSREASRLRGQALKIQFVGYQGTRRGRTRPFAFTFEVKPDVASSGRRFVRDRDSAWLSGGFMVATPELSAPELAQYSLDARFEVAHGGPPVQAVLSAVDRAAELRSTVGDRVLDVRLQLYPRPTAEVRLHAPQGQVDVVDVHPGAVEVAYTPWFITAAGASQPMIATPDMEWHIGGSNLSIQICGTPRAEHDDRLLVAMAAAPQGRRPTRTGQPPRIDSDVFARHTEYGSASEKLTVALRLCGLRSAGYLAGVRDPRAIAVGVQSLPRDDQARWNAMIAGTISKVGLPVLLVAPDQRAMTIGDWDVGTANRLAPLVYADWKRTRSV